MAKKSSFFKKKKNSSLAITVSQTEGRYWCYPIRLQCIRCGSTLCVDRVGTGVRLWQGSRVLGWCLARWLHGILTNISWTRTVVEVLLCAHRLASTRIWPISSQAWLFVLHCLAWNGLVLFHVSRRIYSFSWGSQKLSWLSHIYSGKVTILYVINILHTEYAANNAPLLHCTCPYY
jgi:hypothetical protein